MLVDANLPSFSGQWRSKSGVVILQMETKSLRMFFTVYFSHVSVIKWYLIEFLILYDLEENMLQDVLRVSLIFGKLGTHV